MLTAMVWPANHCPWLSPAWAAGPWNGHAVAFTFSSDDGRGPDNRAWEPVFVSRGLSYTAFIVTSWIDRPELDKLTTEDLKRFYQDGIEIGSHSRTHVRLTDVSDAEVFDELLGSSTDLETMIGGGYHCRTVAYPFHVHNPHIMSIVDSLGFTAARDGGMSPRGYPDFSAGKTSWAETDLFEVPLAATASYLVGIDNANSEAQTRLQVRKLLASVVTTSTQWINIYAHSLSDIDAEHMDWILDELQRSDVWIANLAAVADFYRMGHSLPVSAGVGIPITVELSHFGATALPGSILLDWTAVETGGLTGFQVLRASPSHPEYSLISIDMIPPLATNSFADVTAVPQMVYSYELRAFEHTGASRVFGPVSASLDTRPALPREPRLGRAAPNPSAGGMILIPFSLPAREFVTLRILDLSGCTVTTLLEGNQPAGAWSIPWNGSNDRGEPMPAGVYFCELRTPGSRATQKLVRLP